jgi:hypothetical protein
MYIYTYIHFIRFGRFLMLEKIETKEPSKMVLKLEPKARLS